MCYDGCDPAVSHALAKLPLVSCRAPVRHSISHQSYYCVRTSVRWRTLYNFCCVGRCADGQQSLGVRAHYPITRIKSAVGPTANTSCIVYGGLYSLSSSVHTCVDGYTKLSSGDAVISTTVKRQNGPFRYSQSLFFLCRLYTSQSCICQS